MLLQKNAQTSSRDHPSYYSMSNLGSVSEVKQPRHEADQSPPFIAKVNNQWHYTTPTPLAFIVCIGTTLPSLFMYILLDRLNNNNDNNSYYHYYYYYYKSLNKLTTQMGKT